MKTKTRSIYSLILFLCLAWACGPAVFDAFAATAQNPPAAKKAPEAKKPPAAKPQAKAKPQPKAKAKVAPRQDSSHLTKVESSSPKKAAPAATAPAKTKKTAAAQPAKADAQTAAASDKLKSSLDVFAKDCIVRMNRQRRPGISQKEVKRQPDGTYMARYMAVDPDSLQTSYNPTDNNKVIKYIGRMVYHEVEYVSTGKDQKQALAGPFSETNRTPITELIKYKAGKWTY